jgi:hypothetical protein
MSLYLQLQESGVTPISLCQETCDTCDLPMYASTSMELQISENMDIGEWVDGDDKPYTFKENDIQKKEASEFLCPISKTIMCNPVAMSDGYTYDYEHIVKLFTEKLNGVESPVTQKVFIAKAYPAYQLRELIVAWAGSLYPPAFRSNTVIALEKPPKPSGTPPPLRPPASTNPSVVPPPPLPPASIPPGNPGPSQLPPKKSSNPFANPGPSQLPPKKSSNPFAKPPIPKPTPPAPLPHSNNAVAVPHLIEFNAYKSYIPQPKEVTHVKNQTISFFNNDIAIALENYSNSSFIGSKVYILRISGKNRMELKVYADLPGVIRGMAFAPSGLLYVTDGSNNVYVVNKGNTISRILNLNNPTGLAFTSNGYLVAKDGGHVISFSANQAVGKISGEQNGGIACMCTFEDKIFVQFQNGMMQCYDSRGVYLVRAGKTDIGVKSVVLTPSHKFITVSNGKIRSWNINCVLEWTLVTTDAVPSDCIAIRPYKANGKDTVYQVFIVFNAGFYELLNPEPKTLN